MTTKEIEERIEKIRNEAADYDERAHAEEESLHLEFIEYVATLSEHLPELAAKAKLVASTKDMDLYRQ